MYVFVMLPLDDHPSMKVSMWCAGSPIMAGWISSANVVVLLADSGLPAEQALVTRHRSWLGLNEWGGAAHWALPA